MKIRMVLAVIVFTIFYSIPTLAVGRGTDSSGKSYYIETGGTWTSTNAGIKYIGKNGNVFQMQYANIDGDWYYFNERAVMATGWVYTNKPIRSNDHKNNKEWFYFGNDGKQLFNQWIDGTYYVSSDSDMNGRGRMLTNCYTPDGYYVGADGKWDGSAQNMAMANSTAGTNSSSVLSTGTDVQTSGGNNDAIQGSIDGVISSVNRISAPLPDDIMGGYCYAINSADGVKVRWKAKNLTGKTVKYYSVCFSVKNPVGDYCLDQISGQDVKWVYYVGPVAPGDDFIVSDIIGYYGAPYEIIIPLISLEYMDGTKEMIEYMYSTTERHQRIL